ncbi:Bug family tripartite tricarboxylate transporter substrate binding protein [Cupriavidus basilensis]|uniref:Bug family tripartite tricarboxylate transporter substrate binding protein n=1 Tax=Cupriavidus basilensis TaxID=68895 RepID=UPI00157AF964|nr:tripartite tricarboxylate transporter substrate-binding protein [Cupriavidus basilensis]NUA27038.1 tripartite tricarboxylate transporter substrate binding protein [Cupriavidus basilensis]
MDKLMQSRRNFIKSAIVIAAAAGSSLCAAADEFPSKPIRLIVPFSAGGFTDVFARIIAAKMAEILKAPVVVDNRIGAGGIIGAAAAAKSDPDGYTMMLGNNAIYAINSSLYRKLPYKPNEDFAPLTITSRADLYLVVNPSVIKATTFAELKKEIFALPAESPLRSYGSVGVGSTHHLAMELLKRESGIQVTHVPYKGSTPAMQDLIGGQIPMMFNTYSEVGQFIRQGKLRVLGMARNGRSDDMPEVHPLAASGVPGFDVWGWQALAVPAATPAPIREKLHAAYARAIQDPATRKKLIDLGAPPLLTSEQEARDLIQAETKRWAKVIKEANIQVTD